MSSIGSNKKSIITRSESETRDFAYSLGQTLRPGMVVCLLGDLAAGKTTFVKGLASGAVGCPHEAVTSPTFVYLNIYEGSFPFYHFDLYRLEGSEHFLAMGFDEMFEGGGICCFEWSERISSLLPELCIEVRIIHKGGDVREIEVYGEADINI